MNITRKTVMTFMKENKENLSAILNKLEKTIVRGRDEENVPVYLTKCRIKSIDSIYLKTKRRTGINDLYEITDLAGLRILCLFEEDIIEVHKYLLDTLPTTGFNVRLFKFFNWEMEDSKGELYKKTIENIIIEKLKDIKIEDYTRDSGYKSIHYIIEHQIANKNISIEIQLRTLLQDVWGELEHALSYKKGNIHPHIKKSFVLLSRDLGTKDILISHLKLIRDKENFGEVYSLEKAGPIKYFDYEDERIPEAIKTGAHSTAASDYLDFVRIQNPRSKNRDWVKVANSLYAKLCENLTLKDYDNSKLKYFIQMEGAYLKFCEGKLEESKKIYKELYDDCEDSYCLHFRLGELYFIERKIEKSLAEFDRSEELLLSLADYHPENIFKIKMKLAYIYWLLGFEYINFVIKEINDANDILNMHPDVFHEREKISLINTTCYYYLDRYLINGDDSDYYAAKDKIEFLEQIIKDEKASSNVYDTVAWFYHLTYKKGGGDVEYLNRAKQLCMQIEDKENYSSYKFLSENIQRNHILEIMSIK
jgi:ppGpp synthetase/RelA/SpoT-type nucleotidyltranferase